jgi:ankyrin repeat protein
MPLFPLPSHFPFPSLSRARARPDPAAAAHLSLTSSLHSAPPMASDGAALPTSPKAVRRMPFSDLEVGLLDVGRFVALNGYAHECRRLVFVSRDFYGEDDYLVAGKNVEYGDLQRTRLMSLARKGDLRRVTLLLKVGGDVNAADEDGMTPLLLASERGHASVVNTLLDSEANVEARDVRGRTALHLASIGGHVDVVRLLLESEEVDVDAEDDKGQTPLLYADEHGRHVVTKLLAKAGADIEKTDEYGKTILSRALDRRDMGSVRRLINLGAAVLDEHLTHLQRACVKGNEELVCLLLKGRARVEQEHKWNLEAIYEAEDRDEDGWEVRMTVLLHAVRNGHRDVVDLLVKAGADVNAMGLGEGYETALDWALERRDTRLLGFLGDLGARFEPSTGIVHLIDACDTGNLKLVRALVKAGVDVNGCNECYYAPLYFSEAGGHHEITAFLAEEGADMDCYGSEEPVLSGAITRGDSASVRRLVGLGASPSIGLRTACWEGNEAMVRLLLGLGADVNAKNEDGDPALHCAEKRGHHAITRLLRDKGADLEVPGDAGKTVLDCAIEKGDADSVRRLVALGASPSSGLSFARGAGHAAMVKLLLELGGGEEAAAGAGAAVGAGTGAGAAVDSEKG